MSVFTAALPPGAAGAWCRVVVRMAGGGRWWAKLEAADEARGQVVREAFLGPVRQRGGFSSRAVLLHLPAASEGLGLQVFSEGPAGPLLSLRRLGRVRAACALLAQGWRKLPAALRGDWRGLVGRVRTILGQAPARGGEAPPYAVWTDLFDRWGEAEMAALAAAAGPGAAVEVALVADGDAAALAASRARVPTQWRVHTIAVASDWAGLTGDWILVLAAGELLAPQAGACFLHAIRTNPGARGLCADLDHLDAAGRRCAPHLRPPPDAWLLNTDFFARGAWLFERAAHAPVWPCLPADAGRAKLTLARAGPAATLRRVPLILTRCRGEPRRPRTAAAAAPVLAGAAPKVSVIVASSCRSLHVLRSLRGVLRHTAYPDFEILLVVSCVNPADLVQAAILRVARAWPRVRLIELAMPAFNYAAVNNRAAAIAEGALLLLLNDDVVPASDDWLARMVAYVCSETGPQADIVGARLLYGNSMVQHGGVIMGLGNLCEHAFRLAERGDAGPQGLAVLDRRVSAVTAACMLVRKGLFESLGGLEEDFAIALNDVDFCLRAGQAGARIVLAGGVELYHFESMSLGRHYQGTRAQLEAIEVRRLRGRWAAVIAGDPYYHPCASLEVGREFQPGFPPRQTPLSWIRQEPLARH